MNHSADKFVIRLEENARDSIKAAAIKEGISMNSYINTVLRNHLNRPAMVLVEDAYVVYKNEIYKILSIYGTADNPIVDIKNTATNKRFSVSLSELRPL